MPTGVPGSYARNYLQYVLVIVQFDIAYNCWGQLPCALALMVPPALLYEGGNRLVCVLKSRAYIFCKLESAK